MLDVTVVDYGLGNLFSVQRALEKCGAIVKVTSDTNVIRNSTRVVLPGVGAFGRAMDELNRLSLAGVLREFAASGRPLLGICLGMQLLLDESEEFGTRTGLAVIPGQVVPVPRTSLEGERQKIPHIGWSGLVPANGGDGWADPFMAGLAPGDAVYFVHSFMAVPRVASDRVADCLYGGHRVAALVKRGNTIGCQFHPEKSGRVGLGILEAFCKLAA
jgi:glutamine amidotransferase